MEALAAAPSVNQFGGHPASLTAAAANICALLGGMPAREALEQVAASACPTNGLETGVLPCAMR